METIGPRQSRFSGRPSDNDNWQKKAHLRLMMKGLPLNVKTRDIHRNLKKWGCPTKIIIYDPRANALTVSAEVAFEPPPTTDLWSDSAARHDFKASEGVKYRIRFELLGEFQHRGGRPNSVNPAKTYSQRMELIGSKLGFGFLSQRNEMSIMHSITPDAESTKEDGNKDIELVLNLGKKEIEIRFPLRLQSDNKDRTRMYRFCISLDEKFSVWQVQERKEDGNQTLDYVFHLKSPPLYSRELLNQILASHADEGKRWFEDDSWTRQTDIVNNKHDFTVIDQTPVSLRKNLNRINIGCWTTFVLSINEDLQAQGILQDFHQALPDHNVPILKDIDFKLTSCVPLMEASYWALLGDGFNKIASAADLSSLGELSFDVRYQLEVCISQGYLSEYSVDTNFIQTLLFLPIQKAIHMLRHVDAEGETVFEPSQVFTDLRYQKPVRVRPLPRNCIEIQHVTVTATTLKICSPSVEVSNRIIRKYKHYASHFLRVRFEDDEYRGKTRIFATSSTNKMQLLLRRIKRAMENGILVAGRRFEFLAWGNSQFREHGAYFFATVDGGPSAQSIRAEMGEFSGEKVVAKRAARMGQCFSTTQPIAWNPKGLLSKDQTIPDVEINGYTFTDGVGKISRDLARTIASSLRITRGTPSAFQFRMGGCKGIVAIDPELDGFDLKLRGSQFKFPSESTELEVIRCSEFWQPFLSRQLILVLSELGIKDDVFLEMQKEAIARLDKAMVDDATAMSCLRDNVDPNRMTLSISDLVASGFRRVEEPFVTSVLDLWRIYSLKFIKEKAKIPISKGAFLLGTTDETNTLQGHFDRLQVSDRASRELKEAGLPEVFVQYTDPHSGKRVIVEGLCFIARNPSLHKGDVRVVKAVNKAELHHLCDVVVMPQNGDRDLPSMCSGGDLDGDDYVIVWDPKLIPAHWNVKPFHYTPPPPKVAAYEITTSHIIDFFLDHIQNDNLGRIAYAHMAAADWLGDSLDSPECLELVQLHSMAVDYAKTGVPAVMPRRLDRTKWPHYMEKKGGTYHSGKALGRLYDNIKNKNIHFNPETAKSYKFDDRILNSTVVSEGSSKALKEEAALLKHEYDLALQRIMSQHHIKTEQEVWSTFVVDHSKKAKEYKFHEEIGQLSRALKDQYHQAIVETVGGHDFNALAPFAVAAYTYTAEEYFNVMEKRAQMEKENVWEDEMPKKPFISFPWLMADVLGKIAMDTEMKQRLAELDALNLKATNTAAEEVKKVKLKTKTKAAQASDPFAMIDPFSKNKGVKIDTGTDSDASDGVTKDSSEDSTPSPVETDNGSPSQEEPPEAGDLTTSPMQEPPPQNGDAAATEVTNEQMAKHSSLFIAEGVMKDPALMTDAEKAASGYFDDDDDDDDDDE